MIGPATGTARTLAGSDATGTEPNVATRIGATAVWAASVTASGVASQRGPGTSGAMWWAPTTMPAVPATDSWKPTEVTSSGSTSSMPATPSASVRSAVAGRPRAAAIAVTDAIAVARRTDGSARVSRANPTRTARVTTSRGPKRRRVSTGVTMSRANATFSPLTA
ncbi:MAG TPA: hypothetical protein VKB57_28600, partial [Acidimicrobiales bacterium]|nr:hypothetical protein [Acidimicrobiales bacterium]